MKVAIFDAGFEEAYGTATVTVHPIDPTKFAALADSKPPRGAF